ncbi:hypothetical protein GCM10009556_057150 [Acrocarpospora pleiomorpha]
MAVAAGVAGAFAVSPPESRPQAVSVREAAVTRAKPVAYFLMIMWVVLREWEVVAGPAASRRLRASHYVACGPIYAIVARKISMK